jgi:hypothetical protein
MFSRLTKTIEPQIAPVTATGRTNMKQLVSTLTTARIHCMPTNQLTTRQIVSGYGSVAMNHLAHGRSKYYSSEIYMTRLSDSLLS